MDIVGMVIIAAIFIALIVLAFRLSGGRRRPSPGPASRLGGHASTTATHDAGPDLLPLGGAAAGAAAASSADDDTRTPAWGGSNRAGGSWDDSPSSSSDSSSSSSDSSSSSVD